MAKEYICSLSLSGTCKYGGNKRFNYGFVSGTAEFCRHPKQKTFVDRMLFGVIKCPKQDPEQQQSGDCY